MSKETGSVAQGLPENVEKFLPSPDELLSLEESTKVTLRLSNRSLDYFKRKAGVRKGSYQRMIRNLLDYYVAQQG